MKEQGAEEAVSRSGLLDQMEKDREATKEKHPDGQEGNAERFPDAEAEQAPISMFATVLWKVA